MKKMLNPIKNLNLNVVKVTNYLNINAVSKFNDRKDWHISNEEDLCGKNLIIIEKKNKAKKL